MVAALGIVASAIAISYSVPRLMEFAWGNAFTWFGKTFATWAVVAFLWELIFNHGDGEDFDAVDFGGSALLTLTLRAVV